MAVVVRYYGLNYGELPKSGAGVQPITEAASSTGKHMEITINLGDPAGTTAQIAAAVAVQDRAGVVAQLGELLEYLTVAPWPPART